MSLADDLTRRYFAASRDELVLGGVPVSAIAERFGTPVFVYDGHVLDTKWSKLRSALPERVEIYYSFKANPNPHILRKFLDRGAGLEIASGGELHQAVAAGALPERILFAGPGKTDSEIREFVRAGGGELHVESVGEAERLHRICDEADAHVNAAIRINPSAEAQGGAMRMGGKPAPFGVDEEAMEEVVDRLRRSPRVRVTGVHIFAGTQILDPEILGAQYRKCIELAERLCKMIEGPITTVDFGGGLGVPYFDGEHELDIERYGEIVSDVIRDADAGLDGARLIVEPGRYLVAESGVYLSRVVNVKTSRDNTFVVLDGGMNHHLAASGNLGQVIRRNFPIAAATRLGREPEITADVVGPLCTPLDVVGRKLALPPVSAGDLVAVFQSGAYARTASPTGFLSHRTPPEVFVAEGQMREIRRRGTYEDLDADVP